MLINKFGFYTDGLKLPESCPVCGSDLEVMDNGEVRCVNEFCAQKVSHLIANFFETADIKGAGPAFYDAASKDCKTFEDFLANIVEGDEAPIRWAGGINGAKVAEKIRKYLTKPIQVSTYLALFDMESFGERKLALLNGTNFFEHFMEDDFLSFFYDSKTGKPLIEVTERMKDDQKNLLYKRLSSKKDDINACKKYFNFETKKVEVPTTEGKLSGKSFCFTGSACKPRKELEAMVISNGGTVSSVKKGLSYLVTDDTESGSSKNVKAKALGIPVITSLEFVNMCN